MARPEKEANPNKAGGRENAPGQNKTVTFINDATGETREGTMNDFHNTLKAEGFRRVDDEETEAEAPDTSS
jgi:hypothetical protein